MENILTFSFMMWRKR